MSSVVEADAPFVLERRFEAPRSLVFEVWTRLEHLKRWFGPKGASLSDASLDLRPGGVFHYCMRAAGGPDMWGKWTYREIREPDRLVSVVAFSDPAGADARAPWDANWPLRTLSDITFLEDGDGTIVRVEWSPFEASEAERKNFTSGHDSMRQGWGGTMDRLADYLAGQKGGQTMQIAPYITLNGRCEEALRFYEQSLGAKVQMMMHVKDSPMAQQMPPEWQGKVMHASFTLGNSTLMASDGRPNHTEPLSGIWISIGVTEPADAERMFHALADGGNVTMPIQETFWAQRFGMVTDRFAVPWMINCEKPHGASHQG
ncbi:MAG TPA: SRPBCC domain-containing protein [Acetobacteraceae bacterium]|nr:SRPBCC domain-containing protein [Acetobacteraceae bacterium]